MSAATDTAITATQRRAAIGLKLAQLQRRMPNGWHGWSHAEIVQFRADIEAANSRRGNLFDFLMVAGRIANAYGVHMAEIDECWGTL